MTRRRRMPRALACALMALAATAGVVAGGLATTAGAAHAASSPPGKLLNLGAGICMGAGDPGIQQNPQDPSQEQLEPCTGLPGETWTASPLTTSDYRLTDGNGKCLGARGGNPADGTPVEAEQCTTPTSPGLVTPQEWRPLKALPAAPYHQYELINVLTGKCLGIYGAGTTVGSLAVIWKCDDSASNQRWNGVWFFGTVVSPLNGQCMGVYSASVMVGAAIVGWTCQNDLNQAWQLDSGGRLENSATGLCMGPAGNSPAIGALMVQEGCYQPLANNWFYSAYTATEGWLVAPSGYCLTDQGSDQQLVQAPCNFSTARLWTINVSSHGS